MSAVVPEKYKTEEIVKPTGFITPSTMRGTDFTKLQKGGGGGGTDDYEDLDNKPKINNVELVGNKTSSDLNIPTNTQVSSLTTRVADVEASVATKAEQSDLSTLSATVAGKASQTDLNDLTDVVSSKASQSDLADLSAVVYKLDTLPAKVSTIESVVPSTATPENKLATMADVGGGGGGDSFDPYTSSVKVSRDVTDIVSGTANNSSGSLSLNVTSATTPIFDDGNILNVRLNDSMYEYIPVVTSGSTKYVGDETFSKYPFCFIYDGSTIVLKFDTSVFSTLTFWGVYKHTLAEEPFLKPLRERNSISIPLPKRDNYGTTTYWVGVPLSKVRGLVSYSIEDKGEDLEVGLSGVAFVVSTSKVFVLSDASGSSVYTKYNSTGYMLYFQAPVIFQYNSPIMVLYASYMTLTQDDITVTTTPPSGYTTVTPYSLNTFITKTGMGASQSVEIQSGCLFIQTGARIGTEGSSDYRDTTLGRHLIIPGRLDIMFSNGNVYVLSDSDNLISKMTSWKTGENGTSYTCTVNFDSAENIILTGPFFQGCLYTGYDPGLSDAANIINLSKLTS